MRPLISTLICLAFTATSSAQWKDVHELGRGGESCVSSDGAGNVYVVAHLPGAIYKSTNWGASFSRLKEFPKSLSDFVVSSRPDGHVNVAYLRPKIDGLAVWRSTDFGKSFSQGDDLLGPFDREWLVANPKTGKLLMDYSDGYIGGPKSKGAFMVTSSDNGATFGHPVRIDREPSGSYAVDPYLTRSPGGRIYAMWNVTTDYNTVDCYRMAYTDDEGLTFSKPVTVATFPKVVGGKKVDTQERWMLGCIQAVGQKGIAVLYPSYERVTVDRKPETIFAVHCTFSIDGGKTFSKGKAVLSKTEQAAAIRSFRKGKVSKLTYPRFIQTLPWMAVDSKGTLHMVLTDNRAGTTSVNTTNLAKWQVRHAECRDLKTGFGPTEAVSQVYAARRTPMDFLSCATDSKYVYVSWTATPNSDADYPGLEIFTGKLLCARKPIK